MTIFHVTNRVVIAVMTAALVTACETATDLEPAPQADVRADTPPETEDIGGDSVQGVRVLTQADPWPGAMPIESHVTPVRVRIENGGRIPIDVRYRDLTLLGPDGKHYNAVPPYYIDPSVSRPVVTLEQGPVTNPGFIGTGFEIAPYYSPAYPGIPVYEDVFVFDPNYYDAAYRYWDETELPTFEMLQQALPEGVVHSGGNVEGWVYFEKLPEEADRVVLRTDLVDSRSGRQFAEVRVPYQVN